jgi:pimeloyl-ACP methyl ester carboxylesterase
MFAIGSALRRSAATIALAALAACTTHVPLSDSYRGPDAWPTDGSIVYQELVTEPLDVGAEEDVAARIRARFVVRQVSLPSVSDAAEPIEFEYYDVDGDARTPVVVLLPIFNGQLKIPRFFARYFANQGWAAVVVTRGRNPLDALTAPESAVRNNLQGYHRVLDWIELEPELDPSRIGVLGVSLGAMDAVMLTALDQRVNSLVIAMAGGDLSYLLANTNYRRVVRTIDGMAADLGTSREALGAKLDAAIKLDPLAVAPYVDAERVFMILTRTDAIIPFEAQEQLRETMGSPESLYLVTGHRPSVVFFPKVRTAAFEFFERRFERDAIALAMK